MPSELDRRGALGATVFGLKQLTLPNLRLKRGDFSGMFCEIVIMK